MGERSAAAELNTGWRHSGHRRVQVHRDIASFQGCDSPLAVEGRAVRQDCRALFNQVQSGAAGQKIRQFAGQFHTGGPGSDDDQGCMAEAPLAEITDQTLQGMNIVEVLKSEGVVLDSGNAEVVRTGAAGQQQLIPGQPMP